MDEIKENLRQEIINYIKVNDLKQHEAAKIFQTHQPNLNKLIKGHIENFSIDRLVRFLLNAGLKVSIKVDV